MKYTMSCASALLMLAMGLPAQAQFAKPEDAIKYRKASFTVMAAHFGRLGAMANGRAPYDAKAAADNADVVATLSKLPWGAFGEGTDKVTHGPSQKSGKKLPSTKKQLTKCKPKL